MIEEKSLQSNSHITTAITYVFLDTEQLCDDMKTILGHESETLRLFVTCGYYESVSCVLVSIVCTFCLPRVLVKVFYNHHIYVLISLLHSPYFYVI